MTSLQLHSKEVERFSLLTPEQEVALFEQLELGNEQAFDKIVLANLRLVRKITRKYLPVLVFASGMELPDLLQEGYRGLIAAVKAFDWRKGYAFSTFATTVVNRTILEGLYDQANTIRLPAHVAKARGRLRVIINEFEKQGKSIPKVEELARLAEVSLNTAIMIMEYESRVPISLDQLTLSDDESHHEKVQHVSLGPEESFIQEHAKIRLYELVWTLETRSAYILELRFGLLDNEERTLKSVADIVGLSVERVRQLQNEAFDKLREEFGDELRDYLDIFLEFGKAA
jgi:RNA polymerase sigma factor (sigma-70 family)